MQSGSGKSQSRGGSSSKEMCDYCHQQPKFPPYEYCSKACGSRAKAANRGAVTARDPNMCKQCGQRPVYKGHQFCGKNCANNWQSLHGPFYSGYSSGYSSWYGSTSQFYWGPQRTYSPAPARQPHHQPHGHGHGHHSHPGHHGQQGDGQGGFTGIVNALKTIISPGPNRPPPSPKRRSTLPTPPNNHPYSASSSRDPATGSLSTSMPPGMGGKTSPRPSAPTSPGPSQLRVTPVISSDSGTQDQDDSDQGSANYSPSFLPSPPPEEDQDSVSGQYSPTDDMPEEPPTYSTFDDTLPDNDAYLDHVEEAGEDQLASPQEDYGDEDDGAPSPAPPPPPTQAQNKPQGPSKPSGLFPHPTDVGRGKKKDMKGLRSNPLLQHNTAASLHKVCRLEGCKEPVFIDKIRRLPSEYCCLGHREEAAKTGQVEACIVCLKNPRGQMNSFCSSACRDKSMRSMGPSMYN